MTELAATRTEAVFANSSAETPVGAKGPLSPSKRLRGLLKPDRADLFAVTAFAVAIGVLLLATPIAVQALVNFVALGGALPPLVVVALLLLAGLGFAGVLSALQTWTVEMLQRRLFVRMVADLSVRLPRVRHDVYDDSYGPDLVNRFFDIMTIQKVGSILLLDGLSILLSVLVGLIVLAFYHPVLLAFDVILLLVIGALVFGPLRRGTGTAIQESKAKYAVVSWFEEVARNPVLFKTGGAESWVHERSEALARSYLDRRASHYRVVFGQVVGALTLQVLASAALLGIGGYLVIQGSLTLGQLVAAELIVTLVVSSVAKMGKHLESYYDLMAATDKVGQLLDLDVEQGGTEIAGNTDARGVDVELDEVAWRDADERVVFEGVSLRLEPGEHLGITGRSGSGKSTLLELMWRLRRPWRGSIRIDGVDLRDLHPAALRRLATLVSDVPEIVASSLRDNVTLGRPHVDEAMVRAALDRVGLLDRELRLPDGLDTRLRPTGPPLSGAETRRLVLARALAGRPRLLMVQDLLDHLDLETRKEMLDRFMGPDASETLVVVSNAPDVLARCDRVIDLSRKPGGES